MEAATDVRQPRLRAVLRGDEERVTPLELLFDLVFVLAITQCTALMAANPSWEGLARGLLVLGVLWWCWVGYAWLTSVVDPEEGGVRIAIFASMAALLVAALAVPHAFGNTGLVFALSYGFARYAQVVLLYMAGRDNPNLRHSVLTGITASTTIAVGLLVVASQTDGATQGALWALALALDMGGPFVAGVEGWMLVPGHFAERHGLIVLIAIGESIVAVGAGAGTDVDLGVIAAAVLGAVVAAALWWLYFDVVAVVAARKLARLPAGRRQNAMARDSYSYLHMPMVAGIVLVALGMKKTLAHVDHHLDIVPATAMFGGMALYLLAHVAFRYRNLRTLNRQRLLTAAILVALLPLAVKVDALVALAILAGLLVALISYEAIHFAAARDRIRHELAREPASAD
ncbi:MAG TPA: low temperature requirement protein A [Thermoleophilaceae bacterium]|nr:low temperature requirement protein A [Thermoleophilaceae bacterium]